MVAAAGAADQQVQIGAQPDGISPLFDQGAGVGIAKSPAAGGQHTRGTFQQPLDDFAFAFAEGRFAVLGEIFRDGAARRRFKFAVAVEKSLVQAVRQAAADLTFARSHQSNQNNGAIKADG